MKLLWFVSAIQSRLINRFRNHGLQNFLNEGKKWFWQLSRVNWGRNNQFREKKIWKIIIWAGFDDVKSVSFENFSLFPLEKGKDTNILIRFLHQKKEQLRFSRHAQDLRPLGNFEPARGRQRWLTFTKNDLKLALICVIAITFLPQPLGTSK